MEGRHADRLAESTLSYDNASCCVDCLIVVFMLEHQLYVHAAHSMAEVIIQSTARLRMKYIFYFGVRSRKTKLFPTPNAVVYITFVFEMDFRPLSTGSVRPPCSGIRLCSEAIRQSGAFAMGFNVRENGPRRN